MKEHFIGLFENKRTRFLVVLSVAGILLSIYPVYTGLYDETQKKIELIQSWNNLGEKELPPDTIDAVCDQLSTELKNTSTLLGKRVTEHSVWQYLWKLLTGPALFFLTYGISLLLKWHEANNNDKKSVLKEGCHIYIMLICMALINLLTVPFFSPIVNYIFVPSCLSLVAAIIMEIWNDAKKEARDV